MSGRLSIVAGSIGPTSVAQWYRYRFSIQVHNESQRALKLGANSAISFGTKTAHPAEALLGTEICVAADQTVTLSFARARICGLLAAGDYSFEVRLLGHDDQGAAFEEILTDSAHTVRVTGSSASPANSIGVASLWTAVIASKAAYAKLGFLYRMYDEYPDDITFELVPEVEARLDSNDGTPLWGRCIAPDVIAPDWLETSVNLRSWAHLEADKLYNVGILLVSHEGVRCPHQGLNAALRVGGHIRVVLSSDANLLIRS
jgi:hypothetical protein